jgi:hypothetical protein
MAVNVGKTKFILFHKCGKMLTQPLNLFTMSMNPKNITINLIYELERIHNKKEITQNRSFKLLGMHLDEFLSFDYHTKY